MSKIEKSSVRKAKFKRYDELYEIFGTNREEKEVYILAYIRKKQSRDF